MEDNPAPPEQTGAGASAADVPQEQADAAAATEAHNEHADAAAAPKRKRLKTKLPAAVVESSNEQAGAAEEAPNEEAGTAAAEEAAGRKTPKRTGMTSLGFPGLSSQSVSGVFWLFLARKP